MKVVNFGSLNIDNVYRVDVFVRPGETKTVQSLTIHCGGKGLNQSVALARAGLATCHAGFIGPDGIFLKEKLNQCNVDTQYVRFAQESTGHAVIEVDNSGQNRILVYPGTNGILTETYVEEVLRAFVPGDIVLLQNETNLVDVIMEKAAAKGMRVAFNAAPMNAQALKYPLEKVDWLFVNETEGAAISGKTDHLAIAVALRALYPRTSVVLTLGEKGCIYAGKEGVISVGAYEISPVDTTAAGDTFIGFFLRGIVDGQPPEQALRLATAASAIAITRPGAADSIPAMDEVTSFLSKNKNLLDQNNRSMQ